MKNIEYSQLLKISLINMETTQQTDHTLNTLVITHTYQTPSQTVAARHGLSRTIVDRRRHSWTVVDRRGLSQTVTDKY